MKSPEDSFSGELIGITGDDMRMVIRESDLAPDDDIMLGICVQLAGYELGVIPFVNGEDFEVVKADRKMHLREASKLLKFSVDAYPEFSVYYRGTVSELSRPKSEDDDYRSLVDVCSVYMGVMSNLKQYYSPPVDIHAGCYNTEDVTAVLWEFIDEEWQEISTKPQLSKTDVCPGPDYLWGANFRFETTSGDYETRTFRVSWSGNFDGVAYTKYSDEATYEPGVDVSPLVMNSGW